MLDKYAYYYPEGPGYLFISYLGEGHQGCACLVRSVADGQLYVRKSSSLWQRGAADLNREISNSLIHPNIPRCVDWPSADALGVHGDIPRYDSVATYWQFKNGGDLKGLNRLYRDAGKSLPDALQLKALAQVLEAVLHLSTNYISHRDILPCNIFVHWLASPNNNAGRPLLPDFSLGDLGRSHQYDEYLFNRKVAPEEETWQRIACNELAGDLGSVGSLFRKPPAGSLPQPVESACSPFIAEVSQGLMQAARQLRLSFDLARCHKTVEGILTRIQNTLDAYISEVPLANEDIIRPPSLPFTTPLTYAQPAEIEHAEYGPPGPWQIAAVDALTFEKKAIFPGVYRGQCSTVNKSHGWDAVGEEEVRECSGLWLGLRSSSNSGGSSSSYGSSSASGPGRPMVTCTRGSALSRDSEESCYGSARSYN